MELCNVKFDFKLFNPLPVWTALQGNAKRLQRNYKDIRDKLGPNAIAIETRAQILRNVVQDARDQIRNLLQSIPEDQLQNHMAKPSGAVVFGVLRNVDSFFFESLSLCKLLERFYVSLLRRANVEKGDQSKNSFQALIKKTENQVQWEWKKYLESKRNLFMHQTAPYLAVKFDPDDLSRRELVVESNPDVYLRTGDFDNVLRGLDQLLDLCVQDLCMKIGNRTSSASSS
jgi:hypothetical protein